MVFAILLILQAASAESNAPFWKTKEKYYSRIKNERAIVVAVRTEAKSAAGQTLTMNGGGHMDAPQAFAFKESLHFENLKEALDEIKEVREEGDRVYLRSRAYGYEAKMWLKLESVPDSLIRFEVVDGTLKGLRGEIAYTSLSAKKTEIGLSGSYDFVKFPIPKMFAEFGIEVILQRMAFRLRSFIERRFRESPKLTDVKKPGAA